MSMFDKAKDKAQRAVGTAKEKLGAATGNENLRASGRTQRTRGQLKEAAHDLRDRAQRAVRDARAKFTR